MSDTFADRVSQHALAAIHRPDTDALRAELIGNRVTIEQTANALGVTERSIYNAIARHNIPYVKVFGVRYFKPEDLRAALVADHNTAPRGRGRPRKNLYTNAA